MQYNLVEDKPSLHQSECADVSNRTEAYYHDEITAIWKSSTDRDWRIYEKESRFKENWEAF
ncbi:MAG TPA: hypothetical protein VH415_11575 [Nitrososphaeraceae archaeon]|jgi:hypothetical protein